MREDKQSDLWETPTWLFNELNKEFHFNVDVCANKENSKRAIWLKDALDESYWIENTTCFLNPPYSNPSGY